MLRCVSLNVCFLIGKFLLGIRLLFIVFIKSSIVAHFIYRISISCSILLIFGKLIERGIDVEFSFSM